MDFMQYISDFIDYSQYVLSKSFVDDALDSIFCVLPSLPTYDDMIVLLLLSLSCSFICILIQAHEISTLNNTIAENERIILDLGNQEDRLTDLLDTINDKSDTIQLMIARVQEEIIAAREINNEVGDLHRDVLRERETVRRHEAELTYMIRYLYERNQGI